MNFLIGWMIGERVGSAVGAHNEESGNALGGVVIWAMIGWAGGATAYYNIGKTWSGIGTLAAMGIVLALCVRRPLASGFKQMMLNAISYAAGWVMLFNGGYVVIRVGYAVICGQLRTQGLAALPWTSLIYAVICTLAAFGAAFAVGYAIERDRLRIARNQEAFARPAREAQARHAAREEAPRQEQAAPPPPPPPPPPVEDAWWLVLEVEPTATRAEFEAKGRELLKQYHPDLWMSAPPRLKAEAERQTKRILGALEEARAARRAA